MAQPEARKEKPKSGHPFRDNIEVVVFAIIMALGLKVFALEAYQIPTGSMQPNLMGTYLLDETGHSRKGGIYDRVLVDKLTYMVREPERWEVTVFRYPLVTHNNYVKRMVGMPDEDIYIQQGDVWTRPAGSEEAFGIQRKPPGIQDTLWRRVWPTPGGQEDNWTPWNFQGRYERDEAARILSGAAGFDLDRPVRAEYLHGYPASIYRRIPMNTAGANRRDQVGDLRVQFEVQAGAGAERLEVGLRRSRDYIVELALDPAAGRITLSLPDTAEYEWPYAFPEGGTLDVDLAHWDQRVRLRLSGDGIGKDLIHDLDLPVTEIQNSGLWFDSEGGTWRFPTQPRVSRDIHYLTSLNNGSPIHTIPEGHYFMLGDNTQNSLDSRDWSAREVAVDPPVDGRSLLRGDFLQNGSDPFFNNPRWDKAGRVMTFRDKGGDLFTFPVDHIQPHPEGMENQPAPFVPREFIIGRALAVFLPIPPFSPVVRIKTVR